MNLFGDRESFLFCILHSPATFPVPISIPRYTCRESAEIISPLKRFAIATAKSDFPEAVGPTTAIIFFDSIGFMNDYDIHALNVEFLLSRGTKKALFRAIKEVFWAAVPTF